MFEINSLEASIITGGSDCHCQCCLIVDGFCYPNGWVKVDTECTTKCASLTGWKKIFSKYHICSAI